MFQTTRIRLPVYPHLPRCLSIWADKFAPFPTKNGKIGGFSGIKVPILFYFKEINSIHFLPIIFDSATLRLCLEKYYPLAGIASDSTQKRTKIEIK
jgi:hypothetical protein